MGILLEFAALAALAFGAWRVARQPARASVAAFAWLLAAMVVARVAGAVAFAATRATATNLVAAPAAALGAGVLVWAIAIARRRRAGPTSPPTGSGAVASAACALLWLTAHVAAIALALNVVAIVSIEARVAIERRTLLTRRLLIASPGATEDAMLGSAGLGGWSAQAAAARDLIALPRRTRARLAEADPTLRGLVAVPSIAAAVVDPEVLDLLARLAAGSPTALWALGEHPAVLAVARDPAARAAMARIDLVALRDAAFAVPPENAVELAWRWAPLASTLALDAMLADDAAWRPAGATVTWQATRWAAARCEVALNVGERLTVAARGGARGSLLIDDRPVAPAGGPWTFTSAGEHRLVLLLDGGDDRRRAAISAARGAGP